MFGKFLMKVVQVPGGFLLCLIGIILPWRARSAYLNVVGFVVNIMLRSDTFVGFFMDVGFSTEQARAVNTVRRA